MMSMFAILTLALDWVRSEERGSADHERDFHYHTAGPMRVKGLSFLRS